MRRECIVLINSDVLNNLLQNKFKGRFDARII
jgi:hypothetical protein